MKTLWLHIGMAKTASTAIQTFCSENAKLLEREGFCYPIFSISYPGISRAHNGCFLLKVIKDSDGTRDVNQEAANFQEGMKTVHKLFKSYDNVILSNEIIWRGMDVDKKNFWELMIKEAQKGDFNIRVIVYLRRQDSFISSNWNQLVKRQWTEETFEHYISRVDRTMLNYYDKLERMAALIGKENIIVRRFDREKFIGGNIYSDFLDAVGISITNEYVITKEVRNTSLYGNTHEIKRVLNSIPQIKDRAAQTFLVNILQEFSSLSKEKYPSEMFSKEEANALLEDYASGNKKIAEEYLHEPNAELFDKVQKELLKWQKDNPYMADDVIRLIGIAGICLYQENQMLKKEVHELSSFRFHLEHPVKTIIRKIKQLTKK